MDEYSKRNYFNLILLHWTEYDRVMGCIDIQCKVGIGMTKYDFIWVTGKYEQFYLQCTLWDSIVHSLFWSGDRVQSVHCFSPQKIEKKNLTKSLFFERSNLSLKSQTYEFLSNRARVYFFVNPIYLTFYNFIRGDLVLVSLTGHIIIPCAYERNGQDSENHH